MNGDNFDDTSKPTFPSVDRQVVNILNQQKAESDAMDGIHREVLRLTTDIYELIQNRQAGDDSLHLCPKCQKKSHYDPKEFHGLCPACWSVMGISERSTLTGEWYTFCNSACGWFTTEREDWKDTHGYCEECWLKLTPEQRAILKGEEPLPPQETRIVHLPAVPSLWKVFGVSILATALAIAACSVAGYFLVFHLHW